jgi:hypothetical protein
MEPAAKNSRRVTPRGLAARRRNLRKARKVLAGKPFELTPARREANRVKVLKMQEANRGHYRNSPAQRRARQANLAKAWEANRGPNYRRTEARRAAARASIALARAAPRTRESYAYTLRSNLLHGLTVRRLEESVTAFGEDPKEFQANRRLLARAFAPEDEVERRVVQRLADVIWLRLRLYRGQARWEAGMLSRTLRKFQPKPKLGADETRYRADVLIGPFLMPSPVFRYEDQLLRRIERLLRYFLRRRGDPSYHSSGHMSPSERMAIEGVS